MDLKLTVHLRFNLCDEEPNLTRTELDNGAGVCAGYTLEPTRPPPLQASQERATLGENGSTNTTPGADGRAG